MATKKKPTPTKPVMYDAHVLFEEPVWEQLVAMAREETRRPSVLARILVNEALVARARAAQAKKGALC